MKDVASKPRSLDEVLESLGGEFEAWEVRAFFLGAQASTNVRPQHLLGHLFQSERMGGDNIDQVKASLSVITAAWNELIDDRRREQIRLSDLRVNDPPTPSDLAAVAERRAGEILWFVHGVNVGGGGPIQLDAEGQDALRRLGAVAAFCEIYMRQLASKNDQTKREVSEAVVTLGKVTIAVVKLMGDVLSAGAAVWLGAPDEMARGRLGIRTIEGRRADLSTSEAQPLENRRK
jgi:hypothetical protein